MIQIYVCDDNQPQLDTYSNIIQGFLAFEEASLVFALATPDPYALLKKRRENKATGLYFLDIDLQSDINGLELAQQLRALDPRGYIVFITTHSEMLSLTFQYQVEAMDFILKDQPELLAERIQQCIRTAVANDIALQKQRENVISIKIENTLVKLNQDDIIFIEPDSTPHRLIIHTSHGVKRITGTLKALEAILDDRFCRCHTSYLVNMDHKRTLNKEKRQLLMDNDETCPVSMRMFSRVKKFF